MSFWKKAQKHSKVVQEKAAAKLDDVKAAAAEQKIIYGDALKSAADNLPKAHQKALLVGVGVALLTVGGAAFAAGRLGKVEEETVDGFKKFLKFAIDVVKNVKS